MPVPAPLSRAAAGSRRLAGDTWLRARRAGLRRRWDRVPLWLRLISVVLVLTVLALTITMVVATQLLRGYLLTRVDSQLWVASEQVAQGRLPGSGQLAESRLPSEFYVELVNARGFVVGRRSSPLGGQDSRPAVPVLTPARAAELAGRPFTVPSAEDSGHRWRALVRPLADGRGSLVVAADLEEVDSTVSRLALLVLGVGGVVCAGLAVAGYAVVRLSLRPLTAMEDTAQAIAGGDLSRRVPAGDPRTEVGRLGAALNGMLTQIEQAFRDRADAAAEAQRSEERMRRFVADASHELRTPLTSIRGYAELSRQRSDTAASGTGSADGAGPAAELARLLGRVEEEAGRMGVLVDDLLLLARLDQQRPLDRRPADLLSLAADAVIDARARAPERSIELLPPGEDDSAGPVPVTVLGDETRLRQVADNLVGNTLTHTPAGTPVRVDVRLADQDARALAVLEVRDEGPGLAREQAERVFERFYRADATRARGSGGAGLGLSIVAALTEAHGGWVELDTAPGRGSAFRVVLPRQP